MPTLLWKYSSVLREHTVPSRHKGQCVLWTSCKDKGGYDHINLKIDGQWKNLRTHRLSFSLSHNLQRNDLLNKYVSHLRHNESYIEPADLSLENWEFNNQRKGCIHAHFCQHHAPFPDCMLNIYNFELYILCMLIMINTGEHVQDMFRGVGHGILNSSDLLDA
jgi:hypothetical protein